MVSRKPLDVTLIVPFDGSDLAEAALVRAAEFDAVFDESIVAIAVVPEDPEYAREHGWLDENEPFDVDVVTSRLREQVSSLVPNAEFEYRTVDRFAPRGTIADRLRRFARHRGASLVFIGSENAGRLAAGVVSVGSSIAAESTYDVVLVRHRSPSRVDALRSSSPHSESVSDFYTE